MKPTNPNRTFLRAVCGLAVPVALQSMLQSSFSIVDQIMIGQLGSTGIAAIGFAGKFSSVFSVIVSAVGGVAGIMISQYLGQKNNGEVRRSFSYNFLLMLFPTVFFTLLCLLLPQPVMRLYTKDSAVQQVGAEYLFVTAATYLPCAAATMLSTLFRCMEKASLPLYASLSAALLNTLLNYLLIFGHLGFPALGTRGAAIATVVSQFTNCLVLLICLLRLVPRADRHRSREPLPPFHRKQYLAMLLPVLLCEFMWSLGENVYASIYGHIGTDAGAAMTLINPIQGLMTGALCGLSQAAGVIVGKRLGNREYDEAYRASGKLIRYGFLATVTLSVLIVLTRSLYVRIYSVSDSVRQLTVQILLAYALVAPFKVQNMILGGGILRSGGKTKYSMAIDLIGTWGFGVPLGLLAAFALRLSIPYVYFLLSLEECIRFAISLVVFRRKRWMQSLEAG